MLYFVDKHSKWLLFVVLNVAIIQTFSSNVAAESTTSPSKHYCFYGINVSNHQEFVEICVNGSANMTFNTTKSNIPTAANLDQIWMLLTAAMVFLMQCGFTLLESGVVQEKNIQSVVFKNLLNACVSAIGYYLFGFCLSYGKLHSSNPYLGVGDTVILSHDYSRWFYEWAFSTIAATIASCAITERATLFAYFMNSLSMVWWTYPIIVHWFWSETGWLSPFFVSTGSHAHVHGGAIDFAGSCVVFIVGGWAGLAGSLMIGRRIREKNEDVAQTQQNIKQRVLGCLIIWFGFYGFTCGRTLAANNLMLIASKIAVNTTLSAAMGVITVIILESIMNFRSSQIWSIPTLCNGILVGLVSISASCGVVDPWMAIIIGCVGGFLYIIFAKIEDLVGIDDPLAVWPTFGISGCWGMIAVGFFGYHKQALLLAGYDEKAADLGYGMHWGRQLLGPAIVLVWAFAMGVLVFGLLRIPCMPDDKKTDKRGLLRVSAEVEKRGLDSEYHDEKYSGLSLKMLLESRKK